MSLTRIFLLPFLACIFGLGCGKQAEVPTAQVAPEVSSTKPKPKQAALPPPVSVPVFTLTDFDSNSTDHTAIRKAIGVALEISPADMTQENLEKVEKLDLFGAGISDISPVAALTGMKRLNIFGNSFSCISTINKQDLSLLTNIRIFEKLSTD